MIIECNDPHFWRNLTKEKPIYGIIKKKKIVNKVKYLLLVASLKKKSKPRFAFCFG